MSKSSAPPLPATRPTIPGRTSEASIQTPEQDLLDPWVLKDKDGAAGIGLVLETPLRDHEPIDLDVSAR